MAPAGAIDASRGCSSGCSSGCRSDRCQSWLLQWLSFAARRLAFLSFAAPESVVRGSCCLQLLWLLLVEAVSVAGSSSICCSWLQYLSLLGLLKRGLQWLLFTARSSGCRARLQYLWLQGLQCLSLADPVSVALGLRSPVKSFDRLQWLLFRWLE